MSKIPKQTTKWKMKSGRKIRICDMSNQHLINTMALLMRYAQATLLSHRKFYNTYPPPHAEQAEVLFEQEWEYWMEATIEDCVPDIFWKMCDDAKRRELDLKLDWKTTRVVIPMIAKAQ